MCARCQCHATEQEQAEDANGFEDVQDICPRSPVLRKRLEAGQNGKAAQNTYNNGQLYIG